MDTETTQRLRQVADRATPGPWEVYDPNEGSEHGPLWCVANDAFHNPPTDDDEPWVAVEVHVGGREDAEFIALARNLFPAMLDVVDFAEGMLDGANFDDYQGLRDAVEEFKSSAARNAEPA